MKICMVFIAAIIAVSAAQSKGTTKTKGTTETTTSSVPVTTTTVTTHTTGTTGTTTVITTTPAPTSTSVTTEPTTEPTTAPTTAPVKPTNTTLTKPKVGQWSVKKNATVCILVDMAAQLNAMSDNKEVLKINLSPNATSSGQCGASVDYIEWEVADNVSMKFSFGKKDGNFALQNISVTMNADKVKGTAFGSVTDVSVALANSYRCNATSTVNLEGGSFNVTITLSNVMLQAFRDQTNYVFGEAVPCSADKPNASNIVPIAVGAALAGLVVIVLIAYLIGRRQNRQGYESV